MSATDIRPEANVEERPAQAVAEPAPAAGRSTGQLLDELGIALDLSFAKRRRRFATRRACALAALLFAGAAGLAVFVLTRPTGAPAPRPIAPVQGLVARGTTDGVAWALTARTCPVSKEGYVVSLVTASGSMTTPCAGVWRPADTLYDQAAQVALAFGTAPRGARVEVAVSGGEQRTAVIAVDGHRASLPAEARAAELFVSELPFAQTATAITAYGQGSRLLEACSEQRCVAP